MGREETDNRTMRDRTNNRRRPCGHRCRTNFAIFAATGFLLFSGCQNQSGSELIEIIEFSEVFPFGTLGIGQRSDFTEPVELMIYDDESWAGVSSALQPHVPFGPVDFSQVMLAVIATPSQSGGFMIEVESVELLDSVLTVAYLVSEPGIDCITPQVLSVPFQVIEIRKTEGMVLFERRTEQFSCEDF